MSSAFKMSGYTPSQVSVLGDTHMVREHGWGGGVGGREAVGDGLFMKVGLEQWFPKWAVLPPWGQWKDLGER